MAPADNMPDFDSMSQEELMAWMESLAKRQGANAEELTTSADVDIPEIDPDSVVIDEPGYVPYGQERPEPPKRETPPSPPTPAPEKKSPLPGPPPRPQAPPPPSFSSHPTPPVWQPIPSRPSAPPPRAPFQPPPPRTPEPEKPAPPSRPEPEPVSAVDDGLAWLESLAAEQSDLLFNLDLNALTEEIEHRTPQAQEASTNPMAWLENLASEDDSLDLSALTMDDTESWDGDGSENQRSEAAAEVVTDPFESGVDPMAWLENLARRQGAKSEELTTSTPMNIPVPENPVVDEPGYTPFSFDAPIELRRPAPVEPLELDDPAKWLDSLAEAQGFDDEQIVGAEEATVEAKSVEIDDEAIEEAIESGTVSPEQMQAFLERQADLYVQSLEEEARLGDDEPPVPAELPDWLLEQVGPPPEGGWPPSDSGPALTEEITEPPAPTDFPDWLNEDVPTEGELDFDSIFADAGDLYEEPVDAQTGLQIEIDPSDPWVEAFDLEQEQGPDNPDIIPDWYARNISDPERIKAVEQLVQETGEQLLADAELPEETVLEAGAPVDLPDWLADVPEDEEAFPFEATRPEAEIPDWLRELESETAAVSEDMPDWLVESLDEKAAQVEVTPTAVEVVPAPPMQPILEPVLSSAESAEMLEQARTQARQGRLDESLLAYESLIRANAALEPVVADLQSLARQHRDQPAVYRVLGDGLMRQGRLQDALDTYREALNHL